jgi:hypothetical protein
MKHVYKSIFAIVLASLIAPVDSGSLEAADTPRSTVLKPMSGAGVSGQQFLLNWRVGTKQAVSYFQNIDGRCKLTVMVADAYNGAEVPNTSTVRFEAAIDSGRTARMDTAEGKSLEFACLPLAREMNVKAGDLLSAHFPGT